MGKKAVITTIMVLLGLCSAVAADDLYRITVNNGDDAAALRATGADAVLRINDGYLILADEPTLDLLAESGLQYEFVASNVDRKNLALDTRLDQSNIGKYPTVFQEDQVRLFRVELDQIRAIQPTPGLAPLPETSLRMVHTEPLPLTKSRAATAIPLDSLTGLIVQDSLVSYTETLQAFPVRFAGTLGDFQSRDWAKAKFESFGYDSVFYDSFITSAVTGSPLNLQNIIAVKPGATLPDHHIIICAHKDAVQTSPGADDNGSGSAAVLEIARVMKDIPTEATWIFALFDAEEEGLIGAGAYANAAASAGDSIIAVLNMDMIAHYENANYAKLFYGADQSLAERWDLLAESLTGINIAGTFQGSSSGSDHYPFQQQGYRVVFVHEYTFSTVYHSYQDSTSYMNFDYMTRMVKATIATAYDVDATYLPTPGIIFTLESEIPEFVQPNQTTPIQFTISAGAYGSLAAGTEMLHYAANDGGYNIAPLTDLGGGLYEAELPEIFCGDIMSFYISADEVTSGTFTLPDPAQPWQIRTASTTATAFADDFELVTGWTVSGSVSDGAWNRGVPAGGGLRGDPPADFDGSGSCYLTDNVDGNSDVDGGTTILTSPTFDASGGDDATIHYARWFSNDFGAAPDEDVMRIYLSNDNGATWTKIDSAGPDFQSSGGWFEHTLLVSDFLAPTAQMRLRFEASDLGSGSVVEAAVDDVVITTFECLEGYFVVATDSLPTWTEGVPYSRQIIAAGGIGNHTWTDKYGDLDGTGLSLSTSGSLSGTPAAAGEISFTALCTDDADSTAEKLLTLTINPTVIIVASDPDYATQGESYSHQFTADGGTGTHSWSLIGDALTGSGLQLASNGTLSGTPNATGTLIFTVHAEDAVGASDESEITLEVRQPYICADMDHDYVGPNVADLTFFVDYLFRGGDNPPVMDAADVNTSNSVDVGDLTYLVDYLFRGGPAPVCD